MASKDGLVTREWDVWFQTLVLAVSTLQTSVTALTALLRSGGVVPNTHVVGSPGDLYTTTTGGAGTTLWVKETGTATNTGWVGK